jgi:hypothetical protein
VASEIIRNDHSPLFPGTGNQLFEEMKNRIIWQICERAFQFNAIWIQPMIVIFRRVGYDLPRIDPVHRGSDGSQTSLRNSESQTVQSTFRR